MNVTALDLARRFIGVKETPGMGSNPMILGMLQLDDRVVTDDEVPWCAAFVNFIAWLLRLPRSHSLSARSWLTVGERLLGLEMAAPGFDVVVLQRGASPTAGHVGFYVSHDHTLGTVTVLGGNQGDTVSIAAFSTVDVIGVRRIYGIETSG